MNLEKKEAIEESESIEKEVQRAIEAGQTVIKTLAGKMVNTGKSIRVTMTDKHDQHPAQQLHESHENQGDRSRLRSLHSVVSNKSLKIFGPFFRSP